jgi:hypothetical protein
MDAMIGAGLSLCSALLICHGTQLQQYGLVLVVACAYMLYGLAAL